ncbi:MAG TPA: hypothetical protein VG323_07085 [Thermoanaerobaculia bacterium]|nr:hypothetical protein [Thermoanaerobaculia bacterium]
MLEDERLLNESWVELPILCPFPAPPQEHDADLAAVDSDEAE